MCLDDLTDSEVSRKVQKYPYGPGGTQVEQPKPTVCTRLLLREKVRQKPFLKPSQTLSSFDGGRTRLDGLQVSVRHPLAPDLRLARGWVLKTNQLPVRYIKVRAQKIHCDLYDY